jgi:GTP 3',8-cyclase
LKDLHDDPVLQTFTATLPPTRCQDVYGRRDSRRLIDTFARTISYLRLSLTDHCNLRCLYCKPEADKKKLPSAGLLTFEELLRLTSLAVGLGIRKVRLTGGEPLLRRDILSFIRSLNAIDGLEDVRLTTNGVLLNELAGEIHQAGIGKINISLDTLQPERYQRITGADCFSRVWAGLHRVRDLGLTVKINVVVLKGINDDELLDFGRLTLSEPYQVRFIEFMPVGAGTTWSREHYFSSREIEERLAGLAPLLPVQASEMGGPAKIYRYEGAVGSLGIISPIGDHFCDRCNRLRLTAEGGLRSCLLTDQEIDLKSILRGGGSDADIKGAILQATLNKPKGHLLAETGCRNCHGQMSRIGG